MELAGYRGRDRKGGAVDVHASIHVVNVHIYKQNMVYIHDAPKIDSG